MKTYLILAFLPIIWAADVRTIKCPDENVCPVGQTCCEKSGHFGCCDIPESEQQNKKLVPAFSPGSSQNVSYVSCMGTQCSPSWCCDYSHATCCTGISCCPNGYHCCGSAPGLWCCKRKQRCANIYMYCIAGASSISSAIVSLILTFFVAVSLKHF